jgi:hypothetical protein
MPTLYLIPAEREAYDKLPAQLKKAWGGTVESETGTVWETDEELAVRTEYLKKHLSPKIAVRLGKMIQKLQKEGIDAITEEDFPSDFLPHMLSLLGAIGLTPVIYQAVLEAESVKDLEAAASLSWARNQMLMANALLSSTRS